MTIKTTLLIKKAFNRQSLLSDAYRRSNSLKNSVQNSIKSVKEGSQRLHSMASLNNCYCSFEN